MLPQKVKNCLKNPSLLTPPDSSRRTLAKNNSRFIRYPVFLRWLFCMQRDMRISPVCEGGTVGYRSPLLFLFPTVVRAPLTCGQHLIDKYGNKARIFALQIVVLYHGTARKG